MVKKKKKKGFSDNRVEKIQKIHSDVMNGDSEIVDSSESSYNLIKKAEATDSIIKFRKDIHYCVFKTIMNDTPSVLFIFIVNLDEVKAINVGKSHTERVNVSIELIKLLENAFVKLDYHNYSKEVDKNKNMAVIKVITRNNNCNMDKYLEGNGG